MNRIKLLAAVVGGLSVGQALAVTAHTFVDNSGDADITLPGNWNPAVADGAWTTDEFRFLPGFDYKMGSSLTLGQVQMNTAGRRVFPAGTLATALTGDTSWKITVDGVTNVFDGTAVSIAGTVYADKSKTSIVLTNGASLTTADRLKFAWGGNDSTMVVAGKGTSVTATGGNLQFGNGGNNNQIVISDGATATLATGGEMNLSRTGRNNTITVTGSGSWAALGKDLKIGNKNTADDPVYGANGLIVSNGAFATVVQSLSAGVANDHSPSNRIVVSDHAVLSSGTTMTIGESSGLCELQVDSSGTVTNGALSVGANYDLANHKNAASNSVRIVNGGRLVSNGAITIGGSAPGNVLVVTNGASFVQTGARSASSFKLGINATSSGNKVLIDSPAELSIGSVAVGVGSSDNEMTLRDLGADAYIYRLGIGSDAVETKRNVLVWDQDLERNGAYPVNFAGLASDSRVVLRRVKWHKIGDKGDYTSTDFNVARGNTFELHDGYMGTLAALGINSGARLLIDNSVWDHNGERAKVGSSAGTVTIGTSGASNVLEVVNGATFVFTNGTTFAVSATFTPLTNTFNRIVVGDRSTFVIGGNFRINRACNEFVISNGTFQFGTEFGFPDVLPDRSPSTIALTNQLVRFYGANPRMVATGANANFPYQESTNLEGETFVRAGYNEFHFDIPAEGYAEPPMECTKADGRVIFGRTHRIFVTGDEFLKNGGKTMLARGNNASNGMTVDDLATLSSALPPKCKLVVKNNNELWLKAPSQGLMILLR